MQAQLTRDQRTRLAQALRNTSKEALRLIPLLLGPDDAPALSMEALFGDLANASMQIAKELDHDREAAEFTMRMVTMFLQAHLQNTTFSFGVFKDGRVDWSAWDEAREHGCKCGATFATKAELDEHKRDPQFKDVHKGLLSLLSLE